MADIALLHGDFALGRSVVPPHAACVRPAQVRWDPRTPLSLENYVVGEMEEVLRAISPVFAMPDEGALYSAMGSLSGVPRRCGASRLLVSRNAAVSQAGTVVVCYQFHFSVSTKPEPPSTTRHILDVGHIISIHQKVLSLGPPKCVLLMEDLCGCIGF
ncbi:hypothetical protein BGW80DRAFT_1561593 [Lactifluus volemus]|nr:hypothetical protein BGW80DRAFT_1561593 [Lactifluus volemus]